MATLNNIGLLATFGEGEAETATAVKEEDTILKEFDAVKELPSTSEIYKLTQEGNKASLIKEEKLQQVLTDPEEYLKNYIKEKKNGYAKLTRDMRNEVAYYLTKHPREVAIKKAKEVFQAREKLFLKNLSELYLPEHVQKAKNILGRKNI